MRGTHRGEVGLTLHIDHVLIEFYIEYLLQERRVELFDECRGRSTKLVDGYGDVKRGEDRFADILRTHKRDEALIPFLGILRRAYGETGHGSPVKAEFERGQQRSVGFGTLALDRFDYVRIYSIPFP